MSNNADSPDVVSSGDHAQIARIKFDVIGHLPGGDVNYDCVIDLKSKMFILPFKLIYICIDLLD